MIRTVSADLRCDEGRTAHIAFGVDLGNVGLSVAQEDLTIWSSSLCVSLAGSTAIRLRLLASLRQVAFLRRPGKNLESQQSRLDELLAVNEPLSKVYVLLDDFRDVLSQTYVGYAERYLAMWIETAMESGLAVVQRFAKRLRDVSRQVINAVRYQLNNGRLEGFNNLIARILHRGCGYSDADYLKLKLRQAALPTELQVPVFQK